MRAAIGLGSSLGDRRATLETALIRLAAREGIRALACSRWYRTPPLRGGTARNWFLNGVLLLETTLPPGRLLEVCEDEERRAGRRRANHWGDRTLDLDLLLVEGVRSPGPRLILPHPGIHHRDFVRRPLLEVWPAALGPTPLAPLRPRAWPVGRPGRHLYTPRGLDSGGLGAQNPDPTDPTPALASRAGPHRAGAGAQVQPPGADLRSRGVA